MSIVFIFVTPRHNALTAKKNQQQHYLKLRSYLPPLWPYICLLLLRLVEFNYLSDLTSSFRLSFFSFMSLPTRIASGGQLPWPHTLRIYIWQKNKCTTDQKGFKSEQSILVDICAKPLVLTLIKHRVTSKVSEPLACKSIKNLHVQNFCSPCWLQEKHWRWAYDRMASNIFLLIHKMRHTRRRIPWNRKRFINQ